MAIATEKLNMLFQSYASGYSDDQLDVFIANSERIMRKPAALLLEQAGLDASTEVPFTLLDHGCGTGPIAAHLLATVDERVLSRSVLLCADYNSTMVETLNRRIEKCGWANIKTANLDAQDSGLPAQYFSHVTLNFAMHVIPDPEAVLREALRVLKPGGIFAFSVWHKDNSGWMPDMLSSIETLPFKAPMPDRLPMVPNGKVDFVNPDLLPELLIKAGFEDVRVQTLVNAMPIHGAEDYLQCFGIMKDWIVEQYWNEETKKKASGVLDTHIVKHLAEKHGGRGWDLSWTMVLVTCRKPDAGSE
ncbi:S-adenosyl-L-methionine-dependent methyltransferase [Xylaria nigripes]|nr:S-adenosyl-L-methionine-dependent methyltransferase [Xylaria nigripes]